jgi:3-methyladenine DNA glycosylase AlkD
MKEKIREVREFCAGHSDPAVVKKYARYFREGYDGYGVNDKVFRAQRDKWMDEWKGDLTITEYLILGDQLVASGKFEEIAYAIHFISFQKDHFSEEAFERVGKWLEDGIANWGSTDVLCMLVLSHFFRNNIVDLNKLKDWTSSSSKWKRRAVPVTLAELVKTGEGPERVLPVIEPLMCDPSEDVQKGLGTLLRTLWKEHKKETEVFLLKWKDSCGRTVVRYATEKMGRESRDKFKKKN